MTKELMSPRILCSNDRVIFWTDCFDQVCIIHWMPKKMFVYFHVLSMTFFYFYFYFHFPSAATRSRNNPQIKSLTGQPCAAVCDTYHCRKKIKTIRKTISASDILAWQMAVSCLRVRARFRTCKCVWIMYYLSFLCCLFQNLVHVEALYEKVIGAKWTDPDDLFDSIE